MCRYISLKKEEFVINEHFLKILVDIEFGARRTYLSTNLSKIIFNKMKINKTLYFQLDKCTLFKN